MEWVRGGNGHFTNTWTERFLKVKLGYFPPEVLYKLKFGDANNAKALQTDTLVLLMSKVTIRGGRDRIFLFCNSKKKENQLNYLHLCRKSQFPWQ
ncbi:hypothetical protein POVCU1_045670 [Plasmodium ovale curtisi]|uniref:Uncharacterized protein n=1 Tax=Plasmodium ovale curtisi TaxID=864141 RepID=A0A1A8WZF9_PLAOA|nr:hypothetical protein POVCU1_045670 [Plasmodium ovale curtisi]